MVSDILNIVFYLRNVFHVNTEIYVISVRVDRLKYLTKNHTLLLRFSQLKILVISVVYWQTLSIIAVAGWMNRLNKLKTATKNYKCLYVWNQRTCSKNNLKIKTFVLLSPWYTAYDLSIIQIKIINRDAWIVELAKIWPKFGQFCYSGIWNLLFNSKFQIFEKKIWQISKLNSNISWVFCEWCK